MANKRPARAASAPRPTDNELNWAGRNEPATIEDLIKRLQIFARHAPGARAVQSKDGEGNDFSPLLRVSLGVYEPRDDCTGDLREPKERGSGVYAVMLWPIS